MAACRFKSKAPHWCAWQKFKPKAHQITSTLSPTYRFVHNPTRQGNRFGFTCSRVNIVTSPEKNACCNPSCLLQTSCCMNPSKKLLDAWPFLETYDITSDSGGSRKDGVNWCLEPALTAVMAALWKKHLTGETLAGTMQLHWSVSRHRRHRSPSTSSSLRPPNMYAAVDQINNK